MVTKGGYRDTLIGAAVVLAGSLLIGLVYSKDDGTQENGYPVVARFTKADGIGVGSPVRLSGMPVGRVIDQRLDDRFRAVATLSIANGVQITEDTAAVIQTDGLLGSKYIELKPGGAEDMLKPGQEITYTQDAVVIEELLEMIIQQGRAKRGYLDKPLSSAGN